MPNDQPITTWLQLSLLLTARSPVYSHFAASLNGLSTIRAFGAGSILEAEFDGYQDMHSSASYMFISTSRAFAYWMDIFCVLFIAMITLSFFIFPPSSAADVGLAITQVYDRKHIHICLIFNIIYIYSRPWA